MHLLDVKGAKKNIYSGHLKMRGQNPRGDVIDFTNYYMTYNGNPYYVICGEFHFSRYNHEMWEEQIQKIKSCGLNIIASSIFWIHHESKQGNFDFSGNYDIRKFVKLCAKHNLKVILRIGPYAHGECRNGGLPDWLFGRPFEVRTNDEGYLFYVERYLKAIGEQVSDLMFTVGGNIIGIQLENEYMAACSPWELTVTQNREWIINGREGLSHIEKIREIAEKYGLKTAFLTGTGWNYSPHIEDEMLQLWGGYAYWPWFYWNKDMIDHPKTDFYIFFDNHDENRTDDYDKKYPFACCELGGGMQVWYPYRFVVDPKGVEAISLVSIASGCNFLGYYVFQGGRNPVIDNIYTNEQLTPRISYDFQAPLSDFGQVRESYKRLKLIHYSLNDLCNKMCLSKTVIPESQNQIEAPDTEKLRYASRSNGKSGFLFINNFQDHLDQTDKNDIQFEIETDNGKILLPENGKLTVKKDISCVLLFGMELSGIKLRYSTAQYITKVEDTLFFFTHEGMKGEFCFDENYKITDLANADMNTVNGKEIVSVGDGDISSFKTINSDNEVVKFCCLSRNCSLDFWKVNVKGKDYGLICKSNVYCSDSSISLETLDIQEYEMFSYPKLESFKVSEGTVDYMGLKGFFHSYSVKTILPEVKVELVKKYENRAIIKFDKSVLDSLSELYLNIDYTGNIGWAFIDGKLIHDDMSNDTIWHIGLKPFKEQLKDNDLYIYISPVTNGEYSIRQEVSNTVTKILTPDDKPASINSVTASPEKTILLDFN